MAEKVSLPESKEQVPALFSREIVLFPRMQVSLILSEERGIGAISKALEENRLVAFIPTEFEGRLQGVGVLTLVVTTEHRVEGLRVDLRGLWRVRVASGSGLGSGPLVSVSKLDDVPNLSKDETTAVRRVHAQIDEFRQLIPDIPTEVTAMLANANTASELSDLCAMSPTLSHEERLDLLSTLDPVQRLSMLNKHFDRELEALKTMVEAKPIPDCEICADLADHAFDAEESARGEAVVQLLNHMVTAHTAELLNVLAEKYGPAFMKKRSLR